MANEFLKAHAMLTGEVRECFGCEKTFIAQYGEEFCSDTCANDLELALLSGRDESIARGLLDNEGFPLLTRETTITSNDINNLTKKFNIRMKP